MRRHILLIAALASAAPAIAGSRMAPPYVMSPESAEFEPSLECLTQAVYYEARNQSADGQRAVAQVVLNRVRHLSYPDSVCDVVFQGAERVTGCQFSFTCDGSMYRDIELLAWERAQEIARAALSGDVYRPVNLALNYHSTAISPYWAPGLVRQTVVGSHVFYRRPGSTEGDFVQSPGEQPHAAPSATERAPARTVRARGARTQQVSYEMPVLERAVIERPVVAIPVAERPVRVRTVSARRPGAGAPAASRRAVPTRTGPRVTIESGVRIARGS